MEARKFHATRLTNAPDVLNAPEAIRTGWRGAVRESTAREAITDDACRALNLAATLALLVLAAPLMLAIALLIKATSKGPVLYVQQRVGWDRRNGGAWLSNARRETNLGGRPFQMLKFRTMRHVDSTGRKQVWARPDDPRVTPLGRILRMYRLDELPQLINILRGDMNLVGPRPEQVKIFARMRDEIDSYAQRQRVRPGITGWAQVNRQYDRSVDDVRMKLTLDLDYIARRSVFQDLRIMLRTFSVVVLRRGW